VEGEKGVYYIGAPPRVKQWDQDVRVLLGGGADDFPSKLPFLKRMWVLALGKNKRPRGGGEEKSGGGRI